MITVNSIVGNIHKDKKLYEENQIMCQKNLSEKIVISRLESKRVRMRKTSNKGTDVGLILALGTVLKNGDIVYLTKDKIIVVEIKPENVAVLTVKRNIQNNDLFELAIKIGHTLGNLHRPIKVNERKIYVPIQADSELELLNRIFSKIRDHIDITKEKVVLEPEEGTEIHEHT